MAGRLQYPRLPCLNVGRPNKEIWLPMEVCFVIRGQRRMKLDERQQAAMVTQASQDPKARLEWIQRCVRTHAKLDADPSVRAFGMNVSDTLSEVRSRAVLQVTCSCCHCHARAVRQARVGMVGHCLCMCVFE